MVDSGTLDRGKAAGMDADRYLSDNNSYEYLQKTGDLVVTGPTNTNVDDLMVALVF
jgi:hydroxypyruvate reductase